MLPYAEINSSNLNLSILSFSSGIKHFNERDWLHLRGFQKIRTICVFNIPSTGKPIKYVLYHLT